MNMKNGSITSGLDRMNAVLAWWGVPSANGSENIEGQVRRFQALASNLQKAYGEAYSQQLEALFATNARLARSFYEFLHCRQPQGVIAAESNVFATFLEGASLQAQTWGELTQKVRDCCATMAREAAEDVHRNGKEETRTTPAARSARASVGDASRHPTHA